MWIVALPISPSQNESPMSLEAFLSENATPAPVAMAVLVHDSDAVPGALDALDRQVYETEAKFVVGGGAAERTLAALQRGIREAVPEPGALLRIAELAVRRMTRPKRSDA